MLELTYSNRTEALLEHLARRVMAERSAGKGPWAPIHIVIPNPCLKEYLRQGLARALGVAANLQFSYLDGLWQELLTDDGHGLLTDDGHGLLAADLLRAGLLCLLGDPAQLAREELKPVRDYLGRETGQLKRVQLVSELARLFEEYQMSRPDWIDAWRQGRLGGAPDPALEAWQSRLWLETVRLLDSAGGPGRSLRHATLLERIRASRFQGMALPGTLHAFGLTHVAQAYQEVFQAFAPLADTTLHLYALNPCGEFWEDLDTHRNRLWPQLPARGEARAGAWDETTEDPYRLVADGPAALRLWGRPGREKIRLLNEVSACDFTSAFQLPAGATLLDQLQRDILLYQDPQGAGSAAPDPSVRCLACPSPRREAEVVASEIWRLLKLHAQDEQPLHFSDIAVVVPAGAQEACLAHLQAAFQDAHQIPMSQGVGAIPVLGQTLEAVGLLLDLPTTGLTRAALLRVLQHPGLQRRFGDLDCAAWGRWCEEFGIVRGGDRTDWEGTYLDQDALNWDQGLTRIVLGRFMGEDQAFQLGGSAYPVNGARDAEPAAAFIAMVRGLCADARELQRRKADPRAWTRRLGRYLERWLQVDEGDAAETVTRTLDRIRSHMERQTERLPENLAVPALDFIAARHLALEALEHLQAEHPASLTRGVVVAPHAALRAIPFRAIFLMGNGEGSFPTRNQVNALDLRAKERRPGDVSQVEQEKYLFLELLLSAREHLVLSYVALDELSGETFEPSGLYKEFRRLLGGYLAPAWAPIEPGGDPFLESHPLRRFAPEYFRPWFPGAGASLASFSEIAEKEARALWLGTEARNRGIVLPHCLGDLTEGGPPASKARSDATHAWHPLRLPQVVPGQSPGTTSGRYGLDPAALDRLRAALDSPPVPDPGQARDVIRISLGDLRTFLECPLSGAAAVRLGLRNRELEDRTAVADERFESDSLATWSLLRTTALATLNGAGSPEEVYGQGLRRLQARGGAPYGLFSEVATEAHLGTIRGWLAHLQSAHPAVRPTTWHLGAPRPGVARVDHSHPPLVFTVDLGGRPCRVELAGPLTVQLEGSLFLQSGTRPGPGGLAGIRKKALAAFIDHQVLACIDPDHGEHRARFVYESPVGNPPQQERAFRFPALTPESGRLRLQSWIEDLLTGDPAVLLPIEAVLDGWVDRSLSPGSILDYVDNAINGSRPARFSTLYGPVPDPTRFPPPADPMGIMTARLGDYLDRVCAAEPAEPKEEA